MKFKLMILTCLFIIISICVYSADNSKQGTNIDIKEAQNAVCAIFVTHKHPEVVDNEGVIHVTSPEWIKVTPESAGSGFFINKEGYFLTCYHVFNYLDRSNPNEEYDYITTDPMKLTDKVDHMFIKTNDNKRVPFKVVDFDENKDIALCKVLEGYEYAVISLANSQEVEEASKCYSIGTPVANALKNTITDGIISSTERSLSDLADEKCSEEERRYNYSFIQHSSPITKGSDGGPLLNEYGACIGINTIPLLGLESFGLAICINHAKGLLEDNTVEYTKWEKGEKPATNDDKIDDNIKQPVEPPKTEPEPNYIWYIICGAILLIVICVVIYFIMINGKKKKTTNKVYNNSYNNNQPRLTGNTQYSNNSKDNYDDIDIELL